MCKPDFGPDLKGEVLINSAFERDQCEGGRWVLSAKALASLAHSFLHLNSIWTLLLVMCSPQKTLISPLEKHAEEKQHRQSRGHKARGFPTLTMMALCRPNITLQCTHVIHVRKMKLTHHLLPLSLSLHTFVLRYASKGFCLITLTWSEDILPSATLQTKNFSRRRDEQFCPSSPSQMGQNPNSPSAVGQVTDTGLEGVRWRRTPSPEADAAHQNPVG